MKRPTQAQYDALNRAALRGGVWKGYDIRADVIERCIKLGWLTYVGNALSAKGFLVWLEGGPDCEVPGSKSIAAAMAEFEKAAYIDEHNRNEVAKRKEAERASWRRVDSMGVTLTFNEWFAVMDSLIEASNRYRADMHGVVLLDLRERINAKYQKIAKKIEESR